MTGTACPRSPLHIYIDNWLPGHTVHIMYLQCRVCSWYSCFANNLNHDLFKAFDLKEVSRKSYFSPKRPIFLYACATYFELQLYRVPCPTQNQIKHSMYTYIMVWSRVKPEMIYMTERDNQFTLTAVIFYTPWPSVFIKKGPL